MTLVSVIVPAHRLDRWLDEAVESILASTIEDFEVVVVLNGVATVEPRSWMASAHVQLLHSPEPIGPTRAMIRGVEASGGEFIARLDADDRMRQDRLAAQVRYLERHPRTSLVGTAVRRITEDGSPAGSIRMPVGDDIRSHLLLSNTVPHSSVMMRRSALVEVGGYNPALSQMEDYDVILRLAQCGPVGVLSDELTDYRLHGGQISRGAKPTGAHITKVITERRRLGVVIGSPRIAVLARNLVWRAVQFTRYWQLTKPGHEY